MSTWGDLKAIAIDCVKLLTENAATVSCNRSKYQIRADLRLDGWIGGSIIFESTPLSYSAGMGEYDKLISIP